MLQVVIQKIPENLQEFEILAAKGRQPEHICALVRTHSQESCHKCLIRSMPFPGCKKGSIKEDPCLFHIFSQQISCHKTNSRRPCGMRASGAVSGDYDR